MLKHDVGQVARHNSARDNNVTLDCPGAFRLSRTNDDDTSIKNTLCPVKYLAILALSLAKLRIGCHHANQDPASFILLVG
jgi:hypothetical protein